MCPTECHLIRDAERALFIELSERIDGQLTELYLFGAVLPKDPCVSIRWRCVSAQSVESSTSVTRFVLSGFGNRSRAALIATIGRRPNCACASDISVI